MNKLRVLQEVDNLLVKDAGELPRVGFGQAHTREEEVLVRECEFLISGQFQVFLTVILSDFNFTIWLTFNE